VPWRCSGSRRSLVYVRVCLSTVSFQFGTVLVSVEVVLRAPRERVVVC
jgi:hypothetical protein